MAPERIGKRVRVMEVGPRDGLQSEPSRLSLAAKVAFVEGLIEAGVSALEIGAFVRADRVPQMADSEALVRAVGARDIELWALVPNLRGLERATACGIRHVAVFTAASDAFSRANVGQTIAEGLATIGELARQASSQGLRLRGYVSTAFHCPFSGPVLPDDVRRVVLELRSFGCDQLSIADTIGAATPGEVESLLDLLLRDLPAESLGVHFHDTRGTALANVVTALPMGITTIDAAAGGLGGCPFAPGAQGNLATEDLLFMLHGMGYTTGIDLESFCRVSKRLEAELGRALPSRYLQAGPPPSR